MLFYICIGISACFCGYSHVLVFESAPHEVSGQRLNGININTRKAGGGGVHYILLSAISMTLALQMKNEKLQDCERSPLMLYILHLYPHCTEQKALPMICGPLRLKML